MNRIIAGLALAGAIVAATPPDAHAEPYTSPYLGTDHYVSDLARAGVPIGTDAQEVYVGQLICGNLANGMTTTAAATRLINVGLSTDLAIAIVGLAVIDICPVYYPPVPISSPPVSAPTPGSTPVPVTIAGSVRDALA